MKTSLTVLSLSLILGACASTAIGTSAVANLYPTYGNSVNGKVRFVTQSDLGVLVAGEVSGLQPNAEHGFHIHERGDCSGGDGMSAGAHFNPNARQHGHYAGYDYHAGDLPSIKADANGVARFSFKSSSISLGNGNSNVVGRSLVVHRDPDDYKSQPGGNSGPRIACAVIGME